MTAVLVVLVIVLVVALCITYTNYMVYYDDNNSLRRQLARPYESATFEDRLAEHALAELMHIHKIRAGSLDMEFKLVAEGAYKMAQHMLDARQ